MTGYFDKAERSVAELPYSDPASYLDAVSDLERPVIHDVMLNTGDREFPDDLRERILGIIAVKAVRGPGGLPTTENTRDYVLTVRRSELLADLHSAFHALASRRVKCRWGFWSDSPSQNLVSRKCHDEDAGERLGNLMSAMADHTESLNDEQILEDAKAEGIDVKAEADRVRGVLLDAVEKSKVR